MPPRKSIPIKIRDDIVGGAYANNMFVTHTREDFVMDFLYLASQQGSVNARVITTPGHMKRIIRALVDNVAKYEAKFGPIPDSPIPDEAPGLDLN